MQKLVYVLAAGILVLSAGYAAYAARENQKQESMLAEYAARLEQMLVQVEENTLRRLDYEKQLDELRGQLLAANSRVANLDSELTQTREQIDPDYAGMEQRLRQQIGTEYERRARSEQNSPSAASLISQLTSVSMEERMAIMAVQAQYGDFLGSLNVDSQRKDVIAEALVNVTLDQNQARLNLASEQLEARELRQRMMELSGPESVRESLAYVLTADELALLETHQQNQPNIVLGATGPGGRNVFMMSGDRARARVSLDGEPTADGPSTFNVFPGNGGVILQQRIEAAPN